MLLTSTMEKFVQCWGEMGSRWGVNRSVAQIHAILYLAPSPLCSDEITAVLGYSRSNVSASLRELENWRLATPVSLRGSRKQYYQAVKDPWEMFQIILKERRRREIDPTVTVLRACLEEAEQTVPEDSYTTERFRAALRFFDAMIPLYDEVRRLPKGSVENLVKLKSYL